MQTDRIYYSDRKELYRYVDSCDYKPTQEQRPCIGLSVNLKDEISCVANTYIKAVQRAGGVPMLIPATTDPDMLATILSRLDGLILTGGGDINPLYWNEEPIPQTGDTDPFRDRYDLTLVRLAADRQLPILGICRGMQLINVAFGGTLYQDIYAERKKKTIKHSQSLPRNYGSHYVFTQANSRARKLFGLKTLVNSFHHQAIKDIAEGFEVSARSADGIIEAIESPDYPVYGVQWHPESMAAQEDETMTGLFRTFADDCLLFAKAKYIHHRIASLDSHTDTPMLFEEGSTLTKKSTSGKVNIPKMTEGLIDAACVVAYIKQGKRDDESLRKATRKAENILKNVKRQAEESCGLAEIAYTPEDLYRIKQENKKAIFLGIENGYALGKELSDIESNLGRFKKEGVIYITLCHNGHNDLCDSAKKISGTDLDAEWNGLSPKGIRAVKEMNRLGIMVDLSHASEKTFYDTLEVSTYPVIASHSSARTLCDHARNLTDDQLRAIASKGGIVQVCLYDGFLVKEGEATLRDAVRHILHIRNIAGIDHVGVGSDFDGGGGIAGCNASNELINLTVALLREGFTEEDLEKFWGGNFLRVMSRVQSAVKNQPK